MIFFLLKSAVFQIIRYHQLFLSLYWLFIKIN